MLVLGAEEVRLPDALLINKAKEGGDVPRQVANTNRSPGRIVR